MVGARPDVPGLGTTRHTGPSKPDAPSRAHGRRNQSLRRALAIATFNNFSNGTLPSQGVNFDGQTPILLSQWAQPSNRFGLNGDWSVHLSGVDAASGPSPSPISEPSTYG